MVRAAHRVSPNNSKYLLPLDEYDQEELDLYGDLWRPCPSYPNYEASYGGWVRSWVTVSGLKRHNPYYHEGHRLTVLLGDGRLVNRTRGQLVADAFLVPPEEMWQLCYLDGSNKNPSARNLSWEERVDRLIRAEAEGKHPEKNKQFCEWRHPLFGDNVKLNSLGSRACVICMRAYSSRYGMVRRLKRKGLPFEHVTHEFVLKSRGDWVDPEDGA